MAWLNRQLLSYHMVGFGLVAKVSTSIRAILAPFSAEPDPYDPTYVGLFLFFVIFREFHCDIYQVFELRGIN